jgi:hypothetical protein
LTTRRWLAALVVAAAVIAIAVTVAWSQLPAAGAGGLLHPGHRPMTATAPPACIDSVFEGGVIERFGNPDPSGSSSCLEPDTTARCEPRSGPTSSVG